MALFAVVIGLDPPAAFTQPFMLGAVANFDAPASHESIVKQWEDTAEVFEALGPRPGPRELSPDESSKFIPAASRIVSSR